MKIYKLTKDIYDMNTNMFDILNFGQGEAGQQIEITLLANGEPAKFTNMSAVAYFQLDGQTSKRTFVLSRKENVLTINMDASLLSETGFHTCEISLVEGSTNTTFSFKYRVMPSVVFDSLGASSMVINSEVLAASGEYVSSGKYAVLVVGGQSNAVGFDESPVSAIFDAHEHPRIKQLGYWGDNNKQIIPLGHCAENFQNMTGKVNANSPNFKGTKGIHLPLAKRILKHIPEDYELLVIPAAFGGSSFTDPNDPKGGYNPETMQAMDPSTGKASERWGLGEPLYMAMKDRLDYVLSLNEANYYIGTIWCQGENDFKQPVQHGEKFKAMTDDFFAHFNGKYADRVKGGVWSPDQWFIYETVKYFRDPNQHASGAQAGNDTQKIWDQYKAWSPNTYVTLDFGQNLDEWNSYTNKVRGNGSTVGMNQLHTHFGNDAYERLVAPAVYKKMLEQNVF